MALTQMQLIQSLGEAMSWFEREMQWGVEPTELKHLCSRIGELYAAVVTNGQMAVTVNQKGYDVVSGTGERISVKTTAMIGSSGHISFNPRTLELVDRVIVLRINAEEMQIETLLDAPLRDAEQLMTAEADGKRAIPIGRFIRKARPTHELKATAEVTYQDYTLRELESGSIEITREGELVTPALPMLKELAFKLNVPLVNSNGNVFNTRQLGSLIIKSILGLAEAGVEQHGVTAAVAQQKTEENVRSIAEVSYEGLTIREMETGTIEVESGGKLLTPTMRVLRELALRLQLAITNSQGNPYNTRQLGKVVIEKIKDRRG
ncbi:DUF6998 domain-containing protein [Aromatoleum anaerobium]|uniref:DUF6998 domain-containing protein n=1 Tax=Aromatoleum anaerobium TaxID=182180 RepID=UPI001B7D02B8|nr:hypothetical protein [Aromatoleum anaerobium]MCK0505848.1 hypothetical protein [Aromatoleum anaerobium]